MGIEVIPVAREWILSVVEEVTHHRADVTLIDTKLS